MEDYVARNIEEQLSAFLDGELPEEELQLLVRRLEREPAYRATLARYALAGSILRDDDVLPLNAGLPEEMLDAVDSESVGSEPELISAPATGAAGMRAFGRRSAVAAAALVGMVVLGANQWNTDQDSPQVASNDLSRSQSLGQAPVIQGARRSLPAVQPVTEQQPIRAVASRRSLVNRDRMTSYMVSHGEFSRSLQGTMVDSRIFVQQASFEK